MGSLLQGLRIWLAIHAIRSRIACAGITVYQWSMLKFLLDVCHSGNVADFPQSPMLSVFNITRSLDNNKTGADLADRAAVDGCF
jgi:hypothetical protein